MNLYLTRDTQTSYATYGVVTNEEGDFLIPSTLEPPNPVPAGGPYTYYRYQSPHFGTDVFRCDDIPGHTAIEIHWGNFAADTEDCALAGNGRGIMDDPHTGQKQVCVVSSKVAFGQFMADMAGIDSFSLYIRDGFK